MTPEMLYDFLRFPTEMTPEMLDKFNPLLFVLLPEFDMSVTARSHDEVVSGQTFKRRKFQ
jgi:hypothetical protein